MARGRCRRGLAGLIALAGGPVHAGPLLIAPTTIQLEPGRHSAAIEITNESDAPVDLQFRAFAWDQPDGRERLLPTDTLAVSPPIATVAPRAKQVFRVLDLGPAAGPVERSYRLMLNELPRGAIGAIAVNLEFSLPVFRTPGGSAPHLDWSAGAGAGIRVANRGTRRIRVATLAIRQPDGAAVPIPAADAAYILIDSARTFALPAGLRIAAGARLQGTSDAGPIDVPLLALAAR